MGVPASSARRTRAATIAREREDPRGGEERPLGTHPGEHPEKDGRRVVRAPARPRSDRDACDTRERPERRVHPGHRPGGQIRVQGQRQSRERREERAVGEQPARGHRARPRDRQSRRQRHRLRRAEAARPGRPAERQERRPRDARRPLHVDPRVERVLAAAGEVPRVAEEDEHVVHRLPLGDEGAEGQHGRGCEDQQAERRGAPPAFESVERVLARA